jgi:hypothetical protein
MRRLCRTTISTLTGLLLAATAGCGRPDVEYPSFIRDKMLSVTIGYGVLDALSTELSGVQAGDLHGRADCPHGGDISFQGTASAGAALDEFDLALTASACKLSGDFGFFAATATISGQLTLNSSWNRFDETGSDVLRAEELQIRADTQYEGYSKDFKHTCIFSFHGTSNLTSDALFGTLCGKPYAQSFNHRG